MLIVLKFIIRVPSSYICKSIQSDDRQGTALGQAEGIYWEHPTISEDDSDRLSSYHPFDVADALRH